MGRWIRLLVTALAACAALAATPGFAQDASGDAPPLIAGRVAAIEGDVLIWRAEEAGGGQWDHAQVNDVVTVGTGLATDNGRVEVRVGPHVLRLGESSTGGFSQLDYDSKVFNLERGTVSLHLASPQQGEAVALTVAEVRVDFSVPGRYRIDAVGDAPLAVSVFDGQATARYRGNAVAVGPGEVLAMTQSGTNISTARMSALDDWGLGRDLRYQQLQAPRYVSTSMTGYEDLDPYGDWITDNSYGAVWVPRAVPVGWAPYRFGRWRWVQPWGWTWVDAAPWGFAPFHYGRWITVGGRWCWWPGAFAPRPVWAPALVGFVGATGAGVTVAWGGPVVGWYPLAPWHPFQPYYRTSTNYVTVINQTIVQRPPHGVPADVNQRPGSTWVEGQHFREPIAKVRLPARTAPVADVKLVAPPPRPIMRAPAMAGEAGAVGGGRVAPLRPPPAVATNSNFAAMQAQPLPGGETTVTRPIPTRRLEQPRPQPAPLKLPEGEAPRAQTHVPPGSPPPYKLSQKPPPAETARAPTTPTSPQSTANAPRVAGAPPAYATPPVPRTPSATQTPPQARTRVPPVPAPGQVVAPVPGNVPQGMQPNARMPQAAPPQHVQQPGHVPQGQSKEEAGAHGEGKGQKPPVDVPRAKTVAQ